MLRSLEVPNALGLARTWRRVVYWPALIGLAGSLLDCTAGAGLAVRWPELGVYLWVLEINASAKRFYERLGGENAGVTTMESHGGAVVRSCRYTWRHPELLSAR